MEVAEGRGSFVCLSCMHGDQGADRRWRRIGDVLEKRWRIVKVIANVLKGSDSDVSETLVPEGGVISELHCGGCNVSCVYAKQLCAMSEILQEFADEAKTRFGIRNGAYTLIEDNVKAILHGMAD